MKMVNVHKARTELSKLPEAVEAGEDVVIARAGYRWRAWSHSLYGPDRSIPPAKLANRPSAREASLPRFAENGASHDAAATL